WVRAVDDFVDEVSLHTTTIQHSATKVGGGGLIPAGPNLTVSISDNDEAGLRIVPTSLDIDEGASRTYTVELTSQPTGAVSVSLQALGLVSVSPPSLIFTGGPPSASPVGNWNVAQTITVTAVDDDI